MRKIHDDEPRSIGESHWNTQPKWVRVISVVVGVPVFATWMYMIMTGQTFENESVTLALFGLFGVIALLQLFFVARAYWKMDI